MSGPVLLYGQAEAARILGVSRERVGELVAAGRAPEPIALRDGGAPLFSREQLLLWKRAREKDLTTTGETK